MTTTLGVGLPWCLAMLLNVQADLEEKRAMAEWFCQLKECCKDNAFSKPLATLVESTADLLPHGKCETLLRSCFNGKTFNIEIENNFARMQSMKRVSRGRSEIAPSLAAKHLLSEAKLCHLRHIRYVRKSSGVVDTGAKPGRIGFSVLNGVRRVCVPYSDTKCRLQNEG